MFVDLGVRIQCEGGERAVPDISLVDETRNTKRVEKDVADGTHEH